MTATDRLRALLDERGVEWRDFSDEHVLHTTWNDMTCWFNDFQDGWTAWGMAKRGTPEQAVEATLERGECKNVASVEYDCLPGDFQCSECGCIVASGSECESLVYFTPVDFGEEIGWRYCPSCGKKVVK